MKIIKGLIISSALFANLAFANLAFASVPLAKIIIDNQTDKPMHGVFVKEAADNMPELINSGEQVNFSFDPSTRTGEFGPSVAYGYAISDGLDDKDGGFCIFGALFKEGTAVKYDAQNVGTHGKYDCRAEQVAAGSVKFRAVKLN